MKPDWTLLLGTVAGLATLARERGATAIEFNAKTWTHRIPRPPCPVCDETGIDPETEGYCGCEAGTAQRYADRSWVDVDDEGDDA
jgi:hypothetical protein